MITPPLQKILALLLLGVFIVGFSVLLPLPYLGWVDAKQVGVTILKEKFQRVKKLQEKTNLYGEALKNKNPEDLATLLFNNQAPSLASASLQGDFSQISRETEIIGGSFRPLQAQTTAGLTRFGFRVSFQASMYTFLNLLEKLETSDKFIYIDSLKIKAPSNQQKSPPPHLNIQMDVFGFMEAADD